MRRAIALVVAVSAAAMWLLLLPSAARGATPPTGRYTACSGKVCVQLDGEQQLNQPSRGHAKFFYDTGTPGKGNYFADGTIADGAVFTAHQQPGLTPDPSTVRVSNATADAVTTSGNDLSVTLSGAGDQAIEVSFEASYDPNVVQDLTSQGSLTFRSQAAGGPTVTSRTPYLTFSTGVDVAIDDVTIGLESIPDSPDLGYETTQVPHGYFDHVTAAVSSIGASDLPAGASLVVTTTSGFRLGPSGVHLGNGDDDPALPCRGAAPTYTCTLPAVAAEKDLALSATLHADADLPVGRRGSLTFSVDPNPINDLNPDNNTVTENLTVGALAQLAVALRLDPNPVPVGTPATATLVVRNDGPDVAHGFHLKLYITSGKLTLDDLDGGKIEFKDGGNTLVELDEHTTLGPGRTSTYQVHFSPTRQQSAVQVYLGAEQGDTFTPCDPLRSSNAGLAACIRTQTMVDFVHARPASATPPGGGSRLLAATGVNAGSATLLGVLLTVLGVALLVAGTSGRSLAD